MPRSQLSPTIARRRVPRAEREETMLEVAGQTFATHGFHAASMDAIAEAAGISKPMLYNYFGSKQGLYLAYVERSGHALLQSMRGAAAPDSPADERLHAGILAFLTYVDEHRAGWAVLHSEASAQGGPLAAEVAALRSRIAQMLARLFASDAFAHAFVGAGESLANWWLAHPEESKEQIAQRLMQIAAGARGTRAGRSPGRASEGRVTR
jgi:AcrR family transcriptional regulator